MFQGTKYLWKYQEIEINSSVGSGQDDEIKFLYIMNPN